MAPGPGGTGFTAPTRGKEPRRDRRKDAGSRDTAEAPEPVRVQAAAAQTEGAVFPPPPPPPPPGRVCAGVRTSEVSALRAGGWETWGPRCGPDGSTGRRRPGAGPPRPFPPAPGSPPTGAPTGAPTPPTEPSPEGPGRRPPRALTSLPWGGCLPLCLAEFSAVTDKPGAPRPPRGSRSILAALRQASHFLLNEC